MSLANLVHQLKEGRRDEALMDLGDFVMKLKESNSPYYVLVGAMLFLEPNVVNILHKEFLLFSVAMSQKNLTDEACKKYCLLMSIYECIVAHPESRIKILEGEDFMLNDLIKIILNQSPEERDYTAAVKASLSFICAICEGTESEISHWARRTELIFCVAVLLDDRKDAVEEEILIIANHLLKKREILELVCSGTKPYLLKSLSKIFRKLMYNILVEQPASIRVLEGIMTCFSSVAAHPQGRIFLTGEIGPRIEYVLIVSKEELNLSEDMKKVLADMDNVCKEIAV